MGGSPETGMTPPGSSKINRSALAARMERLRIEESDLEEIFARSSGPGGQHVNKVSTAVTLTHRPSGISISVQDSRSQAMNRHLARLRLVEEFERRNAEKLQEQRAAAAKRRRQRATRSRATRQRMVEQKRRRSEIKKNRGRVD
jgi:protein subunit release factor B